MKKLVIRLITSAALLALGFGSAAFLRQALDKSQISASPLTAYEYIEEGDRYYREEKYSKALAMYESALQKEPQNATARLRLGQLYQLKNRYNEAEQELLFAEAMQPDNPDIIYRLGCIYFDLRYWDAAIEHLEKLLTLLPEGTMERAKVYDLLGRSYLWQYDFERGEQYLRMATELEPENFESRHYLALLVARYDRASAAKMLNQIIRTVPTPEIGPKSEVALTELQMVDQMDSDLTRDMQLGKVFLEQDMPTLAFDLFRRSVDNFPDYQSAYYYLGYTYFLTGDTARAVELLEQSLLIGDSPAALAYYYLGEVYTYQQENLKAIEAYERGVDMGDEHFDTFISLAHLLNQEGEYTKAVKSYQRALLIDPGSISTRASLINLYINTLKDYQKAIEVAGRCTELMPDQARCHDLLAWALLSIDELDEAEKQIALALSIDAKLASAHFNMGTLLEKRGQRQQARSEYEMALDFDFEGDIAPLADQALARLAE